MRIHKDWNEFETDKSNDIGTPCNNQNQQVPTSKKISTRHKGFARRFHQEHIKIKV